MSCIHIECTRYGSTSVKRRRSSQFHIGRLKVRATVFNATFNNISVISRLSVLLVEETGGLEKSIGCLKMKPTRIVVHLLKNFVWNYIVLEFF